MQPLNLDGFLEPKVRVQAFIAARMGSSRLPGKVLMEIEGKPMLQRVVERVQRAKSVDRVVVLTSTAERDGAIVAWCNHLRVKCFCGSEQDVLSRFYYASRMFPSDFIVRITGDCPCVDPKLIGHCVKHVGKLGYFGTTEAHDGFDVEVFPVASLERAHKEATGRSREHVTPWMQYNLVNMRVEKPLVPLSKLSVDTLEDLNRVRAIYKALGEEFGLREVEEHYAKGKC